MQSNTLLIVRSKVPTDLITEFDRWYGSDHSPLATTVLGASGFWRYWSDTDPQIHFAFYEFQDADAAVAAQASPGNAGLIKEYDERWGGRIERTREIVTRAPVHSSVHS
jgi:hypothetical protein